MGYTEYYRMWNIPIFDFIGQYMYQEISYVSLVMIAIHLLFLRMYLYFIV